MLVENLPPDCAAARAIRGHTWVDLNYQIAQLTDSVHQLMRTVAGTVSKNIPAIASVWKPTDPDVIGDTSEADQADVIAYLDSMKPPREEPTDA